MDNHRGIGLGGSEHLDATGERKVVYCHQCENEWWQDEHGLVCPRCEGEATEVVEIDQDPRDLRPAADLSPSLRDLQNHSPWASTNTDSDPEEADIEEHITHGPGGSIMISQTIRSSPRSSRTRPETSRRRSPVPYMRDRDRDDPSRSLMRSFHGMMEGLMEGGPSEGPPSRVGGAGYEDHFPRPGEEAGPWHFNNPHGHDAPRNRNGSGSRSVLFHDGPDIIGSRVTFTTGRFGGPARLPPRHFPPEAGGPPVDEITRLLSTLFDSMATPTLPGEHPARDGPGPRPLANNFPALLAALMNPANAASGDAVYTQEALDRVISQLMEAHPTSSSAPGPAAPSTISSLPKRALTEKDLEGNKKVTGKNGEEVMKGECSVCMDDVGVGEEMVFLPCKHWFHDVCASAWLSEHDSCPICRKSISPESSSNSNNNNGGSGSGNGGGGSGRGPFRRASGSSSGRSIWN